ncbi:hypothetical protein PG1C_02895 [Rugosibacter aromaticivorans]|uniref:Uncharacterized protein n=1 Tax=Rugosibacter aromaticivorans TaxID=1565605 RepID=A0A0C5IYA0_9PROT|nr:hypothetical protein [Rugosibacter aromaticivorans]AJP47697.1 hypothetical protein PG1C_02895 [Rugosibacter aromaticivorans]
MNGRSRSERCDPGARAKRGRHTPNTGEAGAGQGLTGVRRAPSCAACPVGDAAMRYRSGVVMKHQNAAVNSGRRQTKFDGV